MQSLDQEWFDGPALMAWLAECAIRPIDYRKYFNEHNRRIIKKLNAGAPISAEMADTLLIRCGLHLHLVPPEAHREPPRPGEAAADCRSLGTCRGARYPAAFKEEVMRTLFEEDLTPAEVGRRFHISARAVRHWRQLGIGAAA